MALYKLEKIGAADRDQLVGIRPSKIDLESRLEDWLEASPGVLTEIPCLWIGRQTTSPLESGRTIYSDLLGIDSDGNLVIVELKRDRAPREVLAQCLDYASWVATLSDDAIRDIADTYLRRNGSEGTFEDIVSDYFELDISSVFRLNTHQRLILVAESFPESVIRVARYLRTNFGLDISVVAIHAFETDSGETVVETEFLTDDDPVPPQPNARDRQKPRGRWSGDVPAKQLVRDSIEEYLSSGQSDSFAPKDIVSHVLNEHPNFNAGTVSCQIIQDCVGHPSRHHYPGDQQDLWWRMRKGLYRRYDPESDQL